MSKFHRRSHHTDESVTYADAAHDPIASPQSPFLGTFATSGSIIANPALSTYGGWFNAATWSVYAKNNARVEGYLFADGIYTPYLTADDVLVNIINISSYELNGFTISGNDFDVEIPDPVPFPYDEKLVLSGVQLSGTGWASFYGSIYTNLNLYVADTAYINNISAHHITADMGMDLSGGIDILGDVNIIGNTDITGNLTVTDDICSDGSLTITKNLYVSGEGYITTLHLSISDEITFVGTVTSDGILTATGEFLYMKINGNERYLPLYTIS